MIWVLPQPLPPSPVNKAKERETDNLLVCEWGEGWGRSQIIRRRESLVLYKSLNTLCFTVFLLHGSISHLAPPPQKKRKPCMRNGNFIFLLNEKSSRSSSPRRGYMCSYTYMLYIQHIWCKSGLNHPFVGEICVAFVGSYSVRWRFKGTVQRDGSGQN